MKLNAAIAIVVLVAVGLGVGGGYLLFGGDAAPDAAESAGGGGTQLWTCGMHPEVIQDHPGNCPQCGMKLTPMAMDEGSGDPGAGQKDRKIAYWVAPMDPAFVSDKPGKSPMGMDLVPVYEDEVRGGPTVKIDPVTQQNMGIRTGTVERGPLVREVRAVGTVDYDERRIGVVALKVGGYVEKLHVSETGARVKKGDPLFDLYAPEVVQAQDEYLRTRENEAKATGEEKARWAALLEQSRTKLLRFDIPESQIADLEARGSPAKVMTWVSPFDGIVLLKNAVEGAFFKPGEPLYRIAGLDTVWVYVSIYEFEFPWVKEGQTARMELPYFPGEKFTGKVDSIYPYLDPKTRDRKVRIVFPNPGYELAPDMYATVVIESRLADDAVLVPGEAVLDTGKRQLVFVAKGNGKFDPREVTVGVESRGGRREVLKGLVPGEIVVTSGQFLLDSESKIREAIQKMLSAREHPAAPAPPPAPAPAFTAPEGLTPVAGEVCPVMGGKPVPDVYVDHEGYRIFLCCTGCPERFRAEPEKYMEKLRRMGAIPEAPKPPVEPRFAAPEGLIPVVPKECPVMGGEPDPAVFVDYKGHRFFFCCAGCPEEFLEDPMKYVGKLRAEGMVIELGE